MELQHILGNVYYLPGPSNVGLVVGKGRRAILIDTGVGQRSGRRLLRLLRDRGLDLVAILNTHCHGDHMGGNAYLVEHTGARVCAPLYDSVMLRYPWWGTMCMFGGAEPLAELRVPRFAPQPCAVDMVVEDGELDVAGLTVRAVSLPGHTGTHTGYIVNGVFFLGDALAGEAELSNSSISYAYSVTGWLGSLEKLRRYSCVYYVLGHGGVESDISGLIDSNIARMNGMVEFVRVYLTGNSVGVSEILEAVCQRCGVEIRNVRQYYRWCPMIHSLLSHLSNGGEIVCEIRDNRLLWRAVEGR